MKIVYCLDQNFVRYAEVSIKSYKEHNPTAEIIVVSESKIPHIGQDRNFLIKLPKLYRNRGEGDRISNAAYLKLFLTGLPFDKILYVDGDTICQKPLKELWDMPCEYINICESHSFGKKQAAALGTDKYGLTGMMLMNLTNLRKIGFTEKCVEVAESDFTPATGWQHDETCINVAMSGKLTFIDKVFNYCHKRFYNDPINEKDAYILHYVGKDKSDMILPAKYKEIHKIGKEIKGKRVAIVGNAKSLFDKRYGAEIDNHDFIIRFNKGFITVPQAQGTKTDMLILALNLRFDERQSFNARYIVNRSKHYDNQTIWTIDQQERMDICARIGKQPSSGFMAIDICLAFGASEIDLYGFDFEETPTFYNPPYYQTQHDYSAEKEIVIGYEKEGKLKINR